MDSGEDPQDCFALRNLSRRLRLIFGGDSALTIRSKEGIGTIAVINIPIQEEDNG